MKADHAQVARLLKTARGQIDGILKMVEEDRVLSGRLQPIDGHPVHSEKKPTAWY